MASVVDLGLWLPSLEGGVMNTTDDIKCEYTCKNYDRIACSETLAGFILFAPVLLGGAFGIIYDNIAIFVLGVISGILAIKVCLILGLIRNRSIYGCNLYCEKVSS